MASGVRVEPGNGGVGPSRREEGLRVPEETSQGYGAVALRQGLDWLARRRRPGAAVMARIMTAFLREVFAYMTRPALRGRVRARVTEALEAHRPRVVVAHSLG